MLTKKIRLRLVYKYTAIIAVMLLCFAIVGFGMCHHVVKKVITDAMYDSLHEEIRELEENGWKNPQFPKDLAVKSDISSMYNYVYHFVDNQLVLSEHPSDEEVTASVERKIFKYARKEAVRKFSAKDSQGRRWQFYILMREINPHLKIVIITNITPFKLMSMQYMYILVATLAVMLLIAWIGGNIIADRILAPFMSMLEKQKRFVSDASHELRTPLAVLLSSLELMEMKKIEPELVSGMKEEVLEMSGLIGDLLELARADNKQMATSFNSFDLSELIGWCLDSMSGLKDICLENLSETPLYITADREMIHRLILILLDNAIKYSPEKTTISVKTERAEKNIKIYVQDQGIGIDEKDIKHIFERFYRADKAHSRKISGTGLGLPIAQEIVKCHHGTIEVESKIGEGTVFVITLPE